MKEKRMPYTPINGCELYYEAGGQGVPVIFVHGGFPSLASTLNDFSRWNWTWENDFAALFHFLWYDRLGCYRSSAPSSGYELMHIIPGGGHSLVHRSIEGRRVVIDFIQGIKP